MAKVEYNEPAAKEKKPTKPRARKPKAKEPTSVDNLIKALKFISVVAKKSGTVEQEFCAMVNHWLLSNNGIVMVGTKIEEDLNCCPQTYQLLDALKKSGLDLAITQLAEGVLSVKSEKFKALIPCVNIEQLQLPAPDSNTVVVDNNLKEALGRVAMLATEGAEQAHYAGVQLQGGSVVATNGQAILEAWHGCDLTGYAAIIPKLAAVAVAKADKNLVKLGLSQSSVTFWFEDESFIRTQVYAEPFPAYADKFDVPNNPWAVPEEFFKGVHAVASFSKTGIVYFDNGVISSREVESEATTYQVESVPNGMAFGAKLLMTVEHAMKTADFLLEQNRVIFFGENIRGVLAGVTIGETYNPVEEDEEIAF